MSCGLAQEVYLQMSLHSSALARHSRYTDKPNITAGIPQVPQRAQENGIKHRFIIVYNILKLAPFFFIVHISVNFLKKKNLKFFIPKQTFTFFQVDQHIGLLNQILLLLSNMLTLHAKGIK